MRRIFLLAILLAAAGLEAQYRETIVVSRILIDVRVTDSWGDAVEGLTKDDFTVTIGRKNAAIESVTWVDDSGLSPSSRSVPVEDRAQDEVATPAGRLLVVFIQTDFAREASRMHGQLNFLRYAEKMVEEFGPEDRIAVFSFDSHLKFRLDFTSDKQQVQQAMRDAIRTDIPPPPPIVPNPSLSSRLDREEMRRAPDSETALVILGNALRHIEGPKTLLLLGWGLGHRTGMKPRYRIARNALDAARVTIFALDTSYADYHDLEVGLKQAAADTGGFYAKTHVFPQIAVDRLRRTLSGHYELELRRPDELKPGTHDLEVRVRRRGATVLAPSTWMDHY